MAEELDLTIPDDGLDSPTAEADDAAAQAAAQTGVWLRLVPLNSRHDGFEADERLGRVLLGRSGSAPEKLRFLNKRISSKHCEIAVDDAGATVTDSSVNGTWVNGTRVNKGVAHRLQSGDELSLAVPSAVEARKGPFADTFVAYVVQLPRSTAAGKRKRGADAEDLGAPPTKLQRDSTDVDDVSTAAAALATTPAPVPSTSTRPPAPPSSRADNDDDDEPDDGLVCHVCQEVMYKSVSVLPCLHNFCAACISDWMKRSQTCPECRNDVTDVRRNHALASLCEAFLTKNPKHARPAEELADMDKRTTYTNDKLRVVSTRIDDSDDGYEDGYDSSEDEEGPCAECHAPGSDGYRCAATEPLHLRCDFCDGAFPNREDCPRPSQCGNCHISCCDKYWATGCPAPGNSGKLATLQDWQPDQLLASLPNAYEQQLLIQYMADQRISAADIWAECVAKFLDGTWPNPAWIRAADTLVCKRCVAKCWEPLLFQWRKAAHDKFPAAVQARDDCWYGRNCRTQKHRPQHAQRLNHICDPTR